MSHVNLETCVDFSDPSSYRRLGLPTPKEKAGRLTVDAGSLESLAGTAFGEIAFRYPKGHLEKLAAIAEDASATPNGKFVARALLRNAAIAAEGVLPMCQDTGTILAYGWKGGAVDVETPDGSPADDAVCISSGAAEAYARLRLRASQTGPSSMLAESNTGDNLPAGIDIRAVPGSEYRFLFVAKGGGSTSKTTLSMESPSILREDRLRQVLDARIRALGTAGCPPYTISVVMGGTSPSQTLHVMELAAYGMLDSLGGTAEADGRPIRSREWEKIVLECARDSGFGAQWGGREMALDARVIRLSRHAANLPLAVGISCSAHRKIRAIVNREGFFLEKLEENPARFLPPEVPVPENAVDVDLSAKPGEWLAKLRALPAGTVALLSGPVTVARDKAHARLLENLEKTGELPSYISGHPVFYAGPTEAPPGMASGSFGPTTAARMDSYLEPFMRMGASLVTIAKGNRSGEAQAAIRRHGGVYLACVGGAAALAARAHVRESRIVDLPELGMEAVRIVRLERLPAIVAIDARGRSIYPQATHG